ncbi:MAG TPA: metallophosphoesterase [Polyangia bacterium]|nr:metallophosphoesterase [Polyangia bacterium]
MSTRGFAAAFLALALTVGLGACDGGRELAGDDAAMTATDGGPENDTAVEVMGPDGGDGTDQTDGGAMTPFSIVVLPDTQFYSSSWPAIFDAQTQWIVDNRDAQGISFVLHVGDVVDGDTPAQWMNAEHSISKLDGNVPYVLSAGNHDYTYLADRVGMAAQFFPVSRLAQSPTFGGTFEDGHIENSYSLMPAGGGRWLVIALEFGPRNEVVAWADGILKKFADVPAIIVTHAYMYVGDTRYDHNGPLQSFSPYAYLMPGTVNDGEDLWQKLVNPNHNVQFVFSGHMVGDGRNLGYAAARLTSVRDDGSRVHQMLANYQYCLGAPCEEVHGGNGFLRILRFSPAEGVVHVQTYSPYLDQSLTDDANTFDLPLP